MWRLALIAAVTGCDASGTPVCLVEDFGSLDAWTITAPRPDEVNANGRLVIAPTASMTTNVFVRGTQAFDLAGGFVEAAIAQYLVPDPNTQSELVVKKDDANYFFIGAAAQSFLFRRRIANADETVMVPFDAAVRYWRVLDDPAAGLVRLQTSVDRAAWADQLTLPPPFALSEMRVDFEVDVFNAGSPSPGRYEVEGVTIASPACDAPNGVDPHRP